MKNYKKYADEINKYKVNKDEYFCDEFIIPHILKKDSCAGIGCEHCHMLQLLWLLEEYEEPQEPKTDWSKVVEQLEELKATAYESYGLVSGAYVAVCNAIEIVKKGGVEE